MPWVSPRRRTEEAGSDGWGLPVTGGLLDSFRLIGKTALMLARERNGNGGAALPSLALLVVSAVITASCGTAGHEARVRQVMETSERSRLWQELGLEFIYIPGGSFMMGLEDPLVHP